MNENNFSVKTTTTNYYDATQLNKVNELIEKNLMKCDCSVLQQLYLIEDRLNNTKPNKKFTFDIFTELNNINETIKFEKLISSVRNFQKFFIELQVLLEKNNE